MGGKANPTGQTLNNIQSCFLCFCLSVDRTARFSIRPPARILRARGRDACLVCRLNKNGVSGASPIVIPTNKGRNKQSVFLILSILPSHLKLTSMQCSWKLSTRFSGTFLNSAAMLPDAGQMVVVFFASSHAVTSVSKKALVRYAITCLEP